MQNCTPIGSNIIFYDRYKDKETVHTVLDCGLFIIEGRYQFGYYLDSKDPQYANSNNFLPYYVIAGLIQTGDMFLDTDIARKVAKVRRKEIK